MKQNDIIIFGCGGHGRVILDLLEAMDNTRVVGFVDDDPANTGKIIDGTQVLGTSSILTTLIKQNVRKIVIGIGDNHIRASVYQRVERIGFESFNAVHPTAVVSSKTKLGLGVVLMPGVIVNTGSCIGNNVCINTGATIDHDNMLADHVHVYPGANLTGGVRVGAYTYIGTNATINPYLKIGANVFVGSSSLVTKDIPDGVTVVGVPARIIKRKETASA